MSAYFLHYTVYVRINIASTFGVYTTFFCVCETASTIVLYKMLAKREKQNSKQVQENLLIFEASNIKWLWKNNITTLDSWMLPSGCYPCRTVSKRCMRKKNKKDYNWLYTLEMTILQNNSCKLLEMYEVTWRASFIFF